MERKKWINDYVKFQGWVVIAIKHIERLSKARVSTLTKMKNSPFPGYSACHKCGGNWGWKKEACHDHVNGHTGSFLFCVDCDKKVTTKQRYEALNKRNLSSLLQQVLFCMYKYHYGELNFQEVLKEIKGDLHKLESEAFKEWPRPKE